MPAQHTTAREHHGAKAVNLELLQRKGFAVPAWGVVDVDVFRRFAAARHIAGAIGAALRETTSDNASAVADRIRFLVTTAELTDDARDAIARACRDAGGDTFAVRSSSPDEDGPVLSFAGQFDTFLNVTGFQDVCARMRECWASAFSERALRYRMRHGLAPTSVGLAVIVQAMVHADKSGVLFTAEPVSGNRHEYVISATRGLGDALMSATAPADTVHIDAATGAARRDGDICLTDEEVIALWGIGGDIRDAFDTPQDVEWAIVGDRLWLVQCRPITTPLDGELRIWDNANIIESFSGLTSPLTYSFAADVYAHVYQEYARALLLPHSVRRQLADWLPAMLGYFHGRVYYNLLHWYRMVRLVPAYRLNRKVLEVSLGVAPLDDEIADGLRPYRRSSPLVPLVSGAAFAVRFLTIGRSVRRFCREFDAAATAFAHADYDGMSCDRVYRRLRLLQRELIERWGPMMVLDAALLLSIGVLHLLTRRWLPAAPDWFFWAAAGPGPEVESAEPVTALRRLAAQLHADPELVTLVLHTPAGQVQARLAAEGRQEFLAAVDDYIARFGFRGVDELKLETPDLTEDPSALFAMLREEPAAEEATRGDVDGYLDTVLSGPRRIVYDVVRRKVSAGMRDRERLRWRRTRAFGVARRMLRAIGKDLARLGALDDWHDVFLLRLEEVRGCCEGTIAHTELKPVVRLRREQRLRDEGITAPMRFETHGVPYWRGNLERAGWGTRTTTPETPSRILRGMPSSPGVVEGTAVHAGAGILLAHHTDPGSVAALSAASALLVERGSPLTHVAVVARELGIPTVVQISDLLANVRAGARLRVDGGAGLVEVLEP
ncbi:PEP/pyruvate-binding domain-containing protein [Kutzneria sp. 744]|uniref:PEP/pyruvate-binding domain-containing protein n=1 Tax=Kutzneria sp. (strain 744) TaxID=345341 RepID=UPI0004B22212|nr:PEP/pyruvate-binding domain-containing protein [Kutzneria sp. 744]